MGWKFWEPDTPTIPARSIRIPLTAEQTETIARPFLFIHEWICSTCPTDGDERPATLRIRSKEDRSTGPSNYIIGREGHASLPSGALTWDGLAEERGWQTRPTLCPACREGMTVQDYKDVRRKVAAEQARG